jgi:hypothetical protein
MEYTVELNGKEYSLPTFKKSVRKEIERVTAGNESKKESDKKSLDMYLLVKKLIGDEAALEVFETDDMEEIDLNLITIAFIRICAAYDKPVNESAKVDPFGGMNDESKRLIMGVVDNASALQNMLDAPKAKASAFARGVN